MTVIANFPERLHPGMLTSLKARFESLPGGSQKAWLLSIYFLFVFVRAPFLLTQGRFWAEEGCVYFQTAWTAPAWQALLAPHLGYYALYPNLCTVLAAKLFPILYAPLLVTWCALVVQMLAAYLVLDCEAFGSLKQRVLALGVLLFTAPNREVWLNTINSQFYFLVCGILVFLSSSNRRVIFRGSVLLMAGLTGILTVYLTPFFWLRALRDRSRGAISQAAILTGCAAVQGWVVLQFLRSGARQIHFQWQDIGPALITRDMALPLTGRLMGTHLAFIIRQHMAPAFLMLWSGAALAALAAFSWLVTGFRDATDPLLPRATGGVAQDRIAESGVLSGAIGTFEDRSWPGLLLVLAAVWTSSLCIYGALNWTTDLIYPSTSERYSFASNIMLALSLVLAIRDRRTPSAGSRPATSILGAKAGTITAPRLGEGLVTGLLAAVLLVGLWDYGTYEQWVVPVTAPPWKVQIEEWDRHPGYALRAWPDVQSLKFTLPHRR